MESLPVARQSHLCLLRSHYPLQYHRGEAHGANSSARPWPGRSQEPPHLRSAMGRQGPWLPSLLLLLLLLLDTSVWAQEEVLDNVSLSCSKDAARFKHLRKYVYDYQAESSSGVHGTADSRSATKIHCKVELEVPQLCSFILKTSQCTLKEVYGFNPEGKALMKKTKNSEEFAAAMSRYELKLAIPEGKQVVLYPEKDEPTHILNIKRGIISALLVPLETEEAEQVSFLDTVYGNCSTHLTVQTRKGSVATEISMERDLKECDGFQPISTTVSPLALIKGLVRPLSTLISSSQSCQYTLDSKRKHVSEASCQEQHLFLPFSYKNKYGMMTQVTQTLKLEDTPKINSRFFSEGAKQVGLAFESTKFSSPPKQAEAIVKTLQELKKLFTSEQNAQRGNLFNKLVTELRGLSDEAVASLLPQMIQISSPITLQALVQCGQPQCYTHILQWLKNEKAHPLLIDVVTYLVAMIPNPSVQRLREIFNTAKEQQSRATLYALSHVVNNYYEMNYTMNTDLQGIAAYLLEQINNECMGEEDHIYLILKVIGNVGRTMEKVMPALKSSVLNCIKSTKPSLLIQKAALQALRKMELDNEVRGLLLETFVDSSSPVEKRLAAYLLLIKGPSSSDINKIVQLLPGEQNEQVKNFVASHIANILNSEELYMEDLKILVKEALKESQLPTIMDFRKFSRNYHFSKSVYLPTFDPVSAKIEGNLIFDPNNYLPIESMLKTTLSVFGFASTDLFEIGLEGKGFEPTMEALFGKHGFFPDSVNKALYWVNGKVPDHISKVLVDHFGYTQDDKHEQDMVNGIMPIVDKLIKDLKSNEIPEARAYLHILGEELGFVKLQDLQFLGRMLMNGVHTLRGIPQMIGEAIREGSKNDLFLHYIFMDNAFDLPTGMGLQLQVTSSGVITPGTKAGVKLELANMQAELVAKPSMSVEFVTNMGTVMPHFARSGVQMNTNFFHETGLEARVALKAGQLKIIIPSPKRPVKLFSGSNTLHLISTTKTEVIPPLIENRQSWSACKPLFTGMNYCTTGAYSNASSSETASYYPLTGDTRYELELKPTGEVEQYSASATYQLQREERGLVDTLKFLVQAEGVKETEATMVFRYNRRGRTLSSEIQIPDFDIDFGTILRVTDESSKDKTSYKLILDIQNKKITEVAFVGLVSSDKKGDGKIKGVISIPRLQAEARSETHTHWSPTKLLLQMDSSATAYGSTISKRVAWRYDDEKIEFDWNTGTNVDTKKVASNFPVDLSDYPKTLYASANSLLDHIVPQTDMTFRYMGSKLIVATSTWLQKASRGIPYAQTLQDHLSGLMELPDFHMPDNLFLKSDGRIKYTLNKNSVKIDIPLPLGGKSSKDLKILESISTPAVNLKSVGLHLPSQEFQVPTFTIPTSYQLQVPLLGVLDLSTNVYSNVYNWSASYTGGNTSRDHFSLQVQYRMKASSVVDLLSYSVQGSGETTYDHRNTFTLSCDGSLRHKFLESKIKFSHVEKVGNNPVSKGLLTLDASSALGPQMSATVHVDSKKKQHLYVRDVKVDGQFRVASFYAKGTYGLSCQSDPSTSQLSGESNLRFNSSYLQGTNRIMGVYQDGTLSLTSTSDLQDGIFKNTASLKYENYELTVKSDSNGQYENFATSNKVDLTFSKQSALLRSENQASYKSVRLFTLLSGSLNPHGVELNADITGTDKTNTGAHKATLRIARDGISTSATTNLKYSPLLLENEMNAALGLSGASMKLTTNSRFREHYAKFSLDGKAALREISLGSVYQAMILGVDSKNIFNFKISQEGLRLSNDMMGSYAEMRLNHANSLNIAGLSLDFSSKLDNIYSTDKFYKQNFNLQLKPYSLLTTLDNNLKYNALDLTSNGKLQLEPLKLNVAGNLKGAYQNDEIKHIYTISYADLTASYRADTVARVQETEFSHRLNIDIAGLASSIDVVTNYNSDSLHFNNVFHSVMAPFNLAIDAHTSGDGKLALWGEHNGKLYSKFLFQVEPLSLAFSHDLRGSTSHHLLPGNSISMALNHRITTLLTPAEQTGTWEFKAKLNNNEYIQSVEAYNTEDKIGVELSGRALTDLSELDSPVKVPFSLSEPISVFNTVKITEAADKPQDFLIVAFIKYDKNQDVHTISLPFFQGLPEYLERNRRAIITVLETIQKEIKDINIDQFVRKYRSALSRLPQEVNEYLNALNLERQVSSAKEKLTAFRENYEITENDVKIALDNAKINLNKKLSQLQTYVIQFDQYIKDNYDLHDFKIAIVKIIDQIIEKLRSLDEYYHIRVNLVKSIHDLYLFVENVDFNRIGSSTASWIQNVDTKYQIRIQIQDKLQQLGTQVQNANIQQLAAKLKQQVEAIDVTVVLDQLRNRVLFQRINDIIEHVKYFVMNLIGNFKVTEKINTFRATVYEFIEKYEVEQQVQVLIDKSVKLAHQYKLKETIQKLSNTLQQVEIKDYYEKLVGLIDGAVKQLKALSFKKIIEEVNRFLDMLVKKLKSFDYYQFVDETNNKIREVTRRINGEIQALELPRKAAALKLWVEDLNVMVSNYMEKLKDTKVTFFIDWLQGALVHIKAQFHDTLEDIRDRIYQMDIQQDLKRYLSLVSQVYSTLVTYISDWWILASKNLTDFAEQYSIQKWTENVKAFVEKGFIVPEIRTFLGTMPAFEVSLHALQAATFQTPDFIVPLTDLRIPSVQINFKMLKDMKIPPRFSTPEFTILNTIHIPSFMIDLIEIKAKIIRTIDQILNSDLQWPVPEVYLRDLKMGVTPLTGFILPDLHFPEITIPEFIIPNLNFKDIQVSDIHIPEFQLPRLSHTVEIPAFGKLHSVLKIQSPLFTLDANGNIRNVSALGNKSEITASITAKGESKLEVLNFDFQAHAQLLELNTSPLVLRESMSFSSKNLRMVHESEMQFSGHTMEGKLDTVASLHTEKNTMEFNNGVILKVNNQLTLDSNTKYFHKLNIPKLDFSSKASFDNEIKTLLEAGHMTWTSSGRGSWNLACPNFSDEGIHSSQISFTVEGPTTSFGLSNSINSKHLRVMQKVACVSNFLNSSVFEIESKAESQHVGSSILTAKGKALLREGKAEITGEHNADLNGKVIGTLKNSLFFSAQPFEISASTNNEGNLKVSFPLKLTGKIDFLNDYALFLSPLTQQASWQAGARFNQYKYNQNFSVVNNENSMEAHVGMSGDANLDFLNIPLTIPEINVPYTTLTTPSFKDFSIWEETGLKEFLKTTKQSFDLSVNAQYKKNKDKHSIVIPLGTFYEFIHQNVNSLDGYFQKIRDNTLHILTTSYNEAKINFDKFKIEKSFSQPSRIFQSRGYTIPGVNIEVSPFTVETLASSHVINTPSFTIPGPKVYVPSYRLVLPSLELPALHVPRNLPKFSLPDIKHLSAINNIFIPAMGNFTYDFSFKSSVITLNTNAGLYNQSDIVAHFLSSSSFVMEALQYKLEGTSRLTRKRGLKLATALSLSNKFVEGNHDSTISLTKKNMDASVKTTVDLHIPGLTMNFKQELNGNAKSKPTISSSIELKYDFSSRKLHSTAKGQVDHKFSLESLTSYFSIESLAKGNIKGSVLSRKYSGNMAAEASTYLNSKGTRSSVTLQGASKVDGIWNLEVDENFAGEANLRRIYATWEHDTKNYLQLKSFYTRGEQTCKAILELLPWTMSALVQFHASQPSSLLDIPHFGQEVTLNANTKNQKVIWKSEVQVHLETLQHSVQFSNDQKEARLDISGSLKGQSQYLENIILPVYDKSLLDILKLGGTTSSGGRQYLHASTSLVYTKNPNGYAFFFPLQELADRFIIPGLKLNDLNSVLATPAFQVPFTDLQIPSYQLGINGVSIYKKLSTSPFALNLPALPKVIFPKVDVLTKYSEPEGSSVPFFEITVPEGQLVVSQFTLPKSFPVGSTILDLNEITNKIADFDLPTITLPEQTIEIPSFKFSVPAGIFIPFFGALAARFGMVSPLYNATWSAGLKNKEDHVETFLDSTCSSTLQFLEYDLNVVGTHKIDNGMLISKTKGILAHHDFSAEYNEDGKYKELWDWHGEARLDITSPAFTELHLYYQEDERSLSSSAASPAIGTLGLDLSADDNNMDCNVYFQPQSSSDKLSIFKMEWRYQKSDDQIQIKFNWEEEATSKLLSSLQDNVPKATEAVYDYVNKYHQEHTGLNLRDASSKLRRSLQINAERTYQRAIKQVDEMDMEFQQAATSTVRTYKEWKDKAQYLYEEMLAQEGQTSFQKFKDKVFDSLVQVTQEYQIIVKHLVDTFIDFLKFTSFQLPGKAGTYTRDELCTMVVRETGKILSQVCLTIHNSLEKLLSYVQDLVEKSDIIRDLTVRFPFHSRNYKLKDIILEYRKLLDSLSQRVQQTFNSLQSTKYTEILSSLQSFVQRLCQDIEEKMKHLKEKQFTYFINFINNKFSTYVPYVLRSLKEGLTKFNSFIQTELQVAASELQQVHQYIKTLREEYFDPSMVGWTVKYYELEEKIINLIKNLIVALKNFHSKYTARATGFASQLSSQVDQFVLRDIQEYLRLLADVDGKGREKIAEFSTSTKEIIKSWSITMKKIISDYHQQFSSKRQEFSDQFSDYYEKFIAESKRLVDLSIQSYHTFLRHITELLRMLQAATASEVSPYIKLTPGELTITF